MIIKYVHINKIKIKNKVKIRIIRILKILIRSLNKNQKVFFHYKKLIK
jgi:hypothetical protein